jgi:hypothetical protein
MRKSVLFISCLMVLAGCSGNQNPIQDNVAKDSLQTKTEKVLAPLVIPPVDTLEPIFEDMICNASIGGEFLTVNSNGTRISIPPQVMHFADGKKVVGDVTISFRELHDAASIWASGIPMDYDASGIHHWFETAGIFEIRMFQGIHEVFLDSGKVITVTFACSVPGSDYHLFYLDEKNARNWHFISDDAGDRNKEKEKLRRKNYGSVMQIPLGPDYFTFNYMAALDVMLNDNSKLIEKSRNNADYKNKIKEYGLTWSNIYNYQSIFFDGNKYMASMLVWKNLSGIPFPDWASKAESVLSQLDGNVYEIEINDKNGHVHRSKIQAIMPIKSLFAQTPKTWKEKYASAKRMKEGDQARLSQMAEVFRTVKIHSLGVYGFNRYLNEDNMFRVSLQPSLEGDSLVMTELDVYYVSASRRSIVKYLPKDRDAFFLMDEPGGFLMALSPNMEILLFDQQSMKKLPYEKLRLETNPVVKADFRKVKTLTSIADIRALF